MSAGATPVAASATTPSIETRSLSGWAALSSRSTRSNAPPHAKQILDRPLALRSRLARGVFRFVQRVFIAEAVLWLTALVCALAGFPAVLTAFCVALVGFVVNCWLAVRTLGPFWRNLMKGGRA